MFRRSNLALLCLSVLAFSIACNQNDQRAQQVQAEAEKFFTTFSTPRPETRDTWGMSNFEVFGLNMDGATETKKVADSPETYEVVIPFWCKGTTPRGEPLKLRRKLSVKLLGDGIGSYWQVQGYEFRDDQALTFWRQSFTWLLLSFILPLLLFLFLRFILWIPADWARGISGLLTLPIVGYVAYLCFASALAVVLCIVVYIILSGFLVGMLNGFRSVEA